MKKITITFLILICQLAFSQDGLLDTSFGTSGYFMTAGSEASVYHQMVDGKIMYRVGNKIYRLTTAGVLDTNFGVNGAITMTQPGTNARYDFLVSSNKVYAFSRNTSGLSNYIYYMGRYNMNGTPDTTLGSGTGYVVLEQQYFDGDLFTTVDADGNIIAGSTTHSGNNVTSNLVARRYSADGVFQQTQFWGVQFGYNMSTSSIGLNTNDVMRSARMAPNGNAVFEAGIGYNHGSYGSSRSGYITVTPDVTNPGEVINGYETFYESAKSSLFIDVENNVYVLSGQTRGPNNQPEVVNVVYKRNAAGNLYNAFGNNGQLTLSLSVGGYPVNFTKLAVQPDGKILIAGATTDQFNTVLSTKLILARFLPTGAIDTTFGTNGYVQHDIAHPTTIANNAATDVILSADGSDIYLVGFNYENSIFLKYSNASLEPLTVPEFTTIAPICAGDAAPVLQTTSNNGVDGTWSPAVVNNMETGTYTFTPAAGEHATTAAITVTVNQPTASIITQTACGSYTWAANGTVYTQSGIYTFVTTNAAGCTNTAALNLTVNQPTSSSVTTTVCDSYTWAENNMTYTQSGIYTYTGTNAAGCNYTATLNLTVNHSTASISNVTACESYTWAANNATYTTSGTYTNITTNAAGCTNTATLQLVVNNDTASTININACDNYTWAANGVTYTAAGTYTNITTNTGGCTDTATLVLTLGNATVSSESTTACDSYTWPANGITYTATGAYTNVTTNASGCDNTATLNLTINHSTVSVLNAVACESYTWSENGTTYTTSGTYTNVTTNASGCSNTATLNLIINHNTASTIVATACDSYTWSANGTTYTASGTYTYVSTDAAGCTNTATLELTINSSTASGVNATACDSYTWAANGITYTSSGNYTFESTNDSGCSNVATLNLTITNAAPVTGEALQTFEANATLGDVVVNPSNVIWYASQDNALDQVGALSSSTLLENGFTYYAVNAESETCVSAPFAVTTTVTLGTGDLDGVHFSSYPNPTDGKVFLKYDKMIQKVMVFNLLGQLMTETKVKATEGQIDFTNFAAGTYLMKVYGDGGVRSVKVLRN